MKYKKQALYLLLACFVGLGGFLLGRQDTETKTESAVSMAKDENKHFESRANNISPPPEPLPSSENEQVGQQADSPSDSDTGGTQQATSQSESDAVTTEVSQDHTLPPVSREFIDAVEQHNQSMTQEVTETLRAAGIAEDEIQSEVDALVTSSQLPVIPGESSSGTPPLSKEEMEADLRFSLAEAGISQEDIEAEVKNIILGDTGGEPDPQPLDILD